MQITEITASWQETANLGDFNNVKPQLSLKATIDPDEDPEAAKAALLEQCKLFVQEAVDQALEEQGKVARYSTEPRYDVIHIRYLHEFYVIVPTGTKLPDRGWKLTGRARLGMAQRVANERAAEDDGAQVIDCSAGDLTQALAILEADQVVQTAHNEEQERQRQAAQEARSQRQRERKDE